MYDKPLREVFSLLKTSERGISQKEAELRIETYGKNLLKEKKKESPFWLFLRQFNSGVVYILMGALVISLILPFYEKQASQVAAADFIDAIVIAAILILNAALGFIQEYRAEKAIEALKKLSSPRAKVIRDGKEKIIDASDIVPGDVLLLEEGEKIPADARIFESIELETQEAALTGESTPVEKTPGSVHITAGVADRSNMVHAGTIITRGKGKAVVSATGMSTEIGKIAELMQMTEEIKTPLQEKLQHLGKQLGIIVVFIALMVFITGYLKGQFKPVDLLLASVAIAVAAVPEGLPAVVTISLALGVKRMVKRNALVRKLPSVETLGSTSVICTDKTGTLTCNQMTVKKLFANGRIIDVSGEGYSIKGMFSHNNKPIDKKSIKTLLEIGSLTNNAKIDGNEFLGDPTEIALLISAEKAGMAKAGLEKHYPRLGELPFNSQRKAMATVHKRGGKYVTDVKGAPDVILKGCTRLLMDNKVKVLTQEEKMNLLSINEAFAGNALRVLGFAYKEGKEAALQGMTFVGLQAMIDPPRPEVKEAIATCKKAGIRVIMITGDHCGTAKAIAEELGIEGSAITGEELERMDDLDEQISRIGIFARVNPEHKTRIVDALRKRGHVIAMTGDGVNDAPAIKNADIGISMGIMGTDVAKEASDMILTDDNFASIVHAVEEGRGIYANIKKFVTYLLSSNLGEVLTLFVAIIFSAFFHNGLPLLAVQILWINLVTDGLPALALSVDPTDPDIMGHKPRQKHERIIGKGTLATIVLVGVIMMLGTLGTFKFAMGNPQSIAFSGHPVLEDWQFEGSFRSFLADGQPEENKNSQDVSLTAPGRLELKKEHLLKYPQTMAFTVLMMFQMFNVLNCQTEKKPILKRGLFTNPWLWLAIGTSIVLQLVVIYTPLSAFFRTVPLSLKDWGIVIAVSSTVLAITELVKLVRNRK